MKLHKIALLFLATAITFNSCKEEKARTVSKVVFEFKKEGELQLKKEATDSIIASFDLEIADDDYQRQTGLMHRASMENKQAMLFIFDNEAYRYFYMKNTIIPLDIMYFDQNKKLINIHVNTKPFDESNLPSTAPAQYVLEINGGLSAQLGVEVGDTFEFSEN